MYVAKLVSQVTAMATKLTFKLKVMAAKRNVTVVMLIVARQSFTVQ